MLSDESIPLTWLDMLDCDGAAGDGFVGSKLPPICALPFPRFWTASIRLRASVYDGPVSDAGTPVDALPYTGDPEADALLAADPMALLIGFVLDQQVPLQKAFSGPLELRRRIGTLDARAIADMPPDQLEAAFVERPALHRFPANMARRTQALCVALVADYGGDGAAVWSGVVDAQELRRRLLGLPGIGEMKASTLLAILIKRFGLRPRGWQDALPSHPTLADVNSAAALADYQSAKRARKAAMRSAS